MAVHPRKERQHGRSLSAGMGPGRVPAALVPGSTSREEPIYLRCHIFSPTKNRKWGAVLVGLSCKIVSLSL